METLLRYSGELGHVAVALALAVSMLQSVLPMIGLRRGLHAWMRLSVPCVWSSFFLLVLALCTLGAAFYTSDFSFALVAQHSHSLKPALYKISAAWGQHEGSLLLWCVMLGLFGCLISVSPRLPLRFKTYALTAQGLVSAAFIAIVLFSANPFVRLHPAPIEGNGFNPLLQDIGLAIHPPILYVGYVGFSAVWCLTLAALLEGKIDSSWARIVQPWTRISWSALTLGIGLGSLWAYRELGWGGWWFWDPVENAALLPWLSGTALLHSLAALKKRNLFAPWCALLAIVTFCLSLLGTFLVRSGVLTSVHSFSNDPQRGILLLCVLAFFSSMSFLLFAIRAPRSATADNPSLTGRAGAIFLNNLLLSTAMIAVLLGTLYPLILDALHGPKISVGAPFFVIVLTPLYIPLAVAMGLATKLPWGSSRSYLWHSLRKHSLLWATVVSGALLSCLMTTLWYDGVFSPAASWRTVVGVLAAFWLLFATLGEWMSSSGFLRLPTLRVIRNAANPKRLTMRFAHLGFAVFLIGAIVQSTWQQEYVARLGVGETAKWGRKTLFLEQVYRENGPNYVVERASLLLLRPEAKALRLFPERRYYPAADVWTTEAAIAGTAGGDFYATLRRSVLGEESSGASADARSGVSGEARTERREWLIRIRYHPLMPWIWTGFLIVGMSPFLKFLLRFFAGIRSRVSVRARAVR